MRKILISILLILLIILAFFTIFQGVSIGAFNILSTNGIIELNNNLTSKINEANTKIKNDLQSRKADLSESIDNLLKNKESYYNLANVSTENEINEANTEDIYNIEYLWLRIGNHARNEGVNLKMDVKNGDNGDSNVKTLTFTVTGQYVAIIDFVSSLEDDSELSFRIDNFSLVPGDGSGNLQATFDVNGVRITLENTTEVVGNTSSTGENQEGQNSVNTEETTTDIDASTTGTDASATDMDASATGMDASATDIGS